MSSNDYYLLRRHPQGGFCLAYGLMDDDTKPEPSPFAKTHETIEEALKEYALGRYESEYGLRVDPEIFEPPVQRHQFGILIEDHRQGKMEETFLLVEGDRKNGYSVKVENPDLNWVGLSAVTTVRFR